MSPVKKVRRTPQFPWETIRDEYRATRLTPEKLSAKYGVSHQAIRARIAREGWERDLLAQTERKAREKIARDAARAAKKCAAKDARREEQITEELAKVQSAVVLDHLKRVQRLKKILDKASDYLEAHLGVEGAPPASELGATLEGLSFGKGDGLGMAMRAIVDKSETLIKLERTALGLDAEDKDARNKPPPMTYESGVRRK